MLHYIEDAVSAYLTLAEQLEKEDVVGQPFNFGNEQPMSILEVANLLIEVSGETDRKPKLVLDKKREGEIQEQYLSSAKARKCLGWQPKFSMEEGLRRTYRWYKNFFTSQG